MEVVLSGCPSCCRHVRASETSCPFCHAAIGSNARRAGRVRIGLAAACAIGLGTVTIAACSSSSPGVSVVYGPPVIPECADAGVRFGGSCSGEVYVSIDHCAGIDGGHGYAFCADGTWSFTITDPATDGYCPLDTGDCGMDGGKGKAGSGKGSGG